MLTVYRYNMNILKSPPMTSHYSSLFLLTSLLAPSPRLQAQVFCSPWFIVLLRLSKDVYLFIYTFQHFRFGFIQ